MPRPAIPALAGAIDNNLTEPGVLDMSESTSLAAGCHDCGAPVTRKSSAGSPPKRCPDCWRVNRRKIQQGVKQRRRDGVKPPAVFTCSDCGEIFPRPVMAGQLPKRCRPCWTAKERRRTQARVAAANASALSRFEALGRWAECIDCGVRIKMAHRKGAVTQRCDPCGKNRIRSQSREHARSVRSMRPKQHRPDYICLGCRSPFRQNQTGRQRIRCAACAYEKVKDNSRRNHLANPLRARSYRARRRVRKYGVGYERFSANEIFERDGWVCGICSAKIRRNLRYPHPMSVSLDHKMPLCKGGAHSRSNTQASHLRCNLRKREGLAPLGQQIPLPI